MAKMDVLKALAVLADSGIELSSDQVTALEEFKVQAMTDSAVKVFTAKLDTPNKGELSDKSNEWTRNMFTLAAEVFDWVKPITRSQGRGTIEERMFRIETPHGSLKVSLSQSTDDEE